MGLSIVVTELPNLTVLVEKSKSERQRSELMRPTASVKNAHHNDASSNSIIRCRQWFRIFNVCVSLKLPHLITDRPQAPCCEANLSHCISRRYHLLRLCFQQATRGRPECKTRIIYICISVMPSEYLDIAKSLILNTDILDG